MTVKELKDKLTQFPDDTVVALYVMEDMNFLRSLRVETQDKGTQSYCKGDHILYRRKETEVLVLRDNT